MKRISVLLGALVVLGCRTHYPVVNETLAYPAGKPDLQRGKNLAFNICGQCHYNWHAQRFTGEEMRDLPGFMGHIYSANLTHGHIADQYTDKQLFYLIKTGVGKDGRMIPYMIRPTIADNDLRDIIAYLRSDDDPLKQDNNSAGVTHLSMIGKMANKVGMKPQELKAVSEPARTEVSEGRYLVDVIGCYHCHSKSILGLNYQNPEASKGYMQGGMKFNIDGDIVHASNLTPDPAMGIGRYDRESFRAAVRDGKAIDGRELHYPMRRFKHLTDNQSDAILAYLKSLQPVDHRVKGH